MCDRSSDSGTPCGGCRGDRPNTRVATGYRTTAAYERRTKVDKVQPRDLLRSTITASSSDATLPTLGSRDQSVTKLRHAAQRGRP